MAKPGLTKPIHMDYHLQLSRDALLKWLVKHLIATPSGRLLTGF
jgi:hypothetical protein